MLFKFQARECYQSKMAHASSGVQADDDDEVGAEAASDAVSNTGGVK